MVDESANPGSDQSNVPIFLGFLNNQTAFRVLIRHFDRPSAY
jgi:hypothetical protein